MRGTMVLGVVLALGWAGRCGAIILLESGDVQFHTTTPGDNSGWQYEGTFSWSLGVPIAPYFFITAKHVGGNVGAAFDFHGDSYATIAVYESPSTTDLRIWEVDHGKPFPSYAPLSSGAADVGALTAVFGRGTRRGAEVVVGSEAKGWKWSTSDAVVRWGKNTVAGVLNEPTYGQLLYCTFDKPGVAGECHISTGDSGGGMFVLEDGLWRLAGINILSDGGPFRTVPPSGEFHGAIYDTGGLEIFEDPDWVLVEDQAQNLPTKFYGTRISASLAWIFSVIAPEELAVPLAPESFSAWQRLYFTPAQITPPATSGPLADFDGDGIANLLEFALNLDPTFNQRANMQPDIGLSGLPVVRLETNAGSGHLTIEFVRRSTGSGSGLTYTAQFASDLAPWQAVGTTTVTAINPRWERVKVVDSLTTNDASRRFARLRVELAQ